MKIVNIELANLKSFKSKTDLTLSTNFNIIIGPNGSGKSNLMDILSTTLRTHFLKPYKVIESTNENNKPSLQIQEPNFYSQPKVTPLDKHIGCEDIPSMITIEFEINDYDLQNIKTIVDYNEKLENTITELYNQYNQGQNLIQKIKNALSWKNTIDQLSAGDKFKYTITNNVIDSRPNNTHEIILDYLNLYELTVILSKDITEIEIHKAVLYIGPHRSLGNNNLDISLSSNTIYDDIYKNMLSSSKDDNNLFKLSLYYFAQKKRKHETQNNDSWENDPEVSNITGYLNAIGYKWDLKLLDHNKNIYEILFGNGATPLPLRHCSSGEREIINLLLGIYSSGIRGGVIIMDEPELHLHPRWQRFILNLFNQLSDDTNNQIIITTHSPVFVKPEFFNQTFRVYKTEHSSQITEFRKSDLKLKQQYHLINSTNNEKIFFADAIILVEGISDILIFNKILNNATKQQQQKTVEIIDVGGKNNFKMYQSVLFSLQIPCYTIADLDYINQIDSKLIKQLLIPNKTKISTNVIRNDRSCDGEKLFDAIDNAINTKSLCELDNIWNYIKGTRTKSIENLTPANQKKLQRLINYQHKNNLYILPKGDIEQYFPKSHKNKDLSKVIDLIENTDTYNNWKKTKEYKCLANIIENILKKTI